LRGLGQCHEFGHDRLLPTTVNIAPVGEIDFVGQVAVAECLGKSGDFIERQRPAGIDRQIEIGITPGPAIRPRAEYPYLCALRQIRTKDIHHQSPVLCRQGDVHWPGHASRRCSSA
jgi:hypothetical protein